MATLIISPHLDDAVLSIGQFIAGNDDVTVLTVFAGIPKDKELISPYDEKMGFSHSYIAARVRRNEDGRALQLLGAKWRYLDYLDGQYNNPADTGDIVNDIIMEAGQYDLLLGPVGIQHPDHVQVAQAMRQAANYLDMPIYLYADLPYRVIYPGAVHELVNGLISEYPGEKGTKDAKLGACQEYSSQWDKEDIVAKNVLISEQMWRLK